MIKMDKLIQQISVKIQVDCQDYLSTSFWPSTLTDVYLVYFLKVVDSSFIA